VARAAVLITLAAAGVLSACAPDRVVQGRPYSLTIPAGTDASAALPLVVFLHGYTGNAVFDDLQLAKLHDQVDARKFIYAQPNGTPNSRGERYWNAADGCCAPAGSTVDDVGFLRAVIEDVRSQHPIDASRILLFGYSNGGFMSLRMVCEASDVVTAVVVIAGSTWSDPARCGSGRPVSLLHVHGTADPTIHYDGSTEPARSPSPIGRYPGAEETNARFAARNGCGATTGTLDPIDIEKGDGPATETTRERYEGCPGDGEVELWSMAGAGHFPRFQDGATGRMLDWLLERPR
jgi:polyhydroxybutyrate depolymerase